MIEKLAVSGEKGCNYTFTHCIISVCVSALNVICSSGPFISKRIEQNGEKLRDSNKKEKRYGTASEQAKMEQTMSSQLGKEVTEGLYDGPVKIL